MLIEPMLLLAIAEPIGATPGSSASQGRSLFVQVTALWPVLLVALGLAIVLATAWKWWSSRSQASRVQDPAASAEHLRQLAHQVAEDLDAKADRLAMLIKHADRRIKALSEMTEGLGAAGSADVVTRPRRRTESAAGARGAVTDPVAEQVYQMADAGLTTVQIAQSLSQPAGNVELMLALRR
jgi:hypothetical protein